VQFGYVLRYMVKNKKSRKIQSGPIKYRFIWRRFWISKIYSL